MPARAEAALAGRLDRPPRSGLGSELGTRVASAAVLVAATLLVSVQGGWLFALFWLVAGLAVAAEWVAVTRVEPRRPVLAAIGVGLALLAALILFRVGLLPSLAVAAGCAVGILALGARWQDRRLGLAGFACAAVIVTVPTLVRQHPALGLAGVAWMFAVVWATDIAAYFTGRRFGGPKLWSRVSPRKTWSGFAGGLAAGTVAGLLATWAAARLGWTPVAGPVVVTLLSALASVISQLGDLGESALKRSFGVKDSGDLIPGHGGVMDRLDGFWAASLVVGLLLAFRHLSS